VQFWWPIVLFDSIDRPTALIVGAGHGIGLGFVDYLLTHSEAEIYATYRDADRATPLLALAAQYPDRLTAIPLDLSDEAQIEALIRQIKAATPRLHLCITSVGVLHDGDRQLQPEKSLRHLNSDNLLHYYQTNAIGPVLLAKHLTPLLKHGDRSILATLSAKVASIGDNQLGGWYGYRASKSALNMLMKNVAIEYGRTCPNTIVALLHPGTTDTDLSKPFQANVAPEKLFTVARCVSQLIAVIEGLEPADSGTFWSWDGNQLPW
jgi:NAD(P)-dependent dehydrogenase (short-subunit alcohol dehydrogenase family)